jgi:hypothetical protein
MRVGYLLLARFAELNPDDTLNVVGGDVERVRAVHYPAGFPFALVAKLEGVTDDDFDARGRIPVRLEMIGPSGAELLAKPYRGVLTPADGCANRSAVRIVLNFGYLTFPEPGRYAVRLQFGDGPRRAEAACAITAELEGA